MAKTRKRVTGDLGEDITAKYLENKGYLVIERNYWKPWGEIDIIAEKGSVLSFVEVKSVSLPAGRQVSHENSSWAGFRPEENLHPAKLKRLHRAVQTYLLQKKVPESTQWQIDLACVFINSHTKTAKVELLENIIL